MIPTDVEHDVTDGRWNIMLPTVVKHDATDGRGIRCYRLPVEHCHTSVTAAHRTLMLRTTVEPRPHLAPKTFPGVVVILRNLFPSRIICS